MSRKTWRKIQAKAWLWASVLVALPAWAYASCPNNCPGDMGPIASNCSTGYHCIYESAYREYACPDRPMPDGSWYCQQCKGALKCPFVGACEWYNVTSTYYAFDGCNDGRYFGYETWIRVYDYNQDSGCC